MDVSNWDELGQEEGSLEEKENQIRTSLCTRIILVEFV